MNSKIIELYQKISQEESSIEPNEAINLIEPHITEIDNLDTNNNEDQNIVLSLISCYAISLSKLGHSKKSIWYLNKSLNLMDNNNRVKDENLLNVLLYEQLLANRGMNHFNNKKYIAAKRDFSRLHNNFPERNTYKKWVGASYYKLYGRLDWMFLVIILIGIFFSFYFDKGDGILNTLSITVIIFGLVGSLTFEYLKRKTKKNYAA